jgi:PAS domain S-box-containing protein
MTIKSKLFIGFLLPMLGAAVIAGLFYFFQERIQILADSSEKIANSSRGYSSLNNLTGEFLLYGSERVRKQWEVKHSALTRQLTSLSLPKREWQASAQIILRRQQKIGRLFKLLVAQKNLDVKVENKEITARKRHRMISRLLFNIREIDLEVSDLEREVHASLLRLQSRFGYMALAVMLSLLGAMGLALWWTSLSISRPLDQLRLGIRKMGKGDLNQRLKMKRKDEVGEVAEEFDQMADQLQVTTVSRDKLTEEIKERQKAEARLLESEERYRSLIEYAPDGILVFDTDKKLIVEGNNASVKMLGYTASELGTMNWLHISPEVQPDGRKSAEKGMIIQQRVLNDEVCELEWVFLSKDQHEIFTILQLNRLPASRTNLIRASLMDITDRKQAERKMERSQRLLAQAERVSRQGAWEWDVVQDIWNFSENWLSIHGCQASYLKTEDLVKIAHPEDADRITQAFQSALAGEAPYDITHRIIKQDNHEVRYVKALGDVEFNSNNEPIIMWGSAQDITDQKMMEEQLRQSQKIEAVGTLAGGIAHDFNNILAAIMGYSELALDTVPDGSEASEDIKQVLKAGYRATDLVRQILSFSRADAQEEKSVQIYVLIKESLKLLRPAIPTTIEIQQDIQDEQDKILADPVQIQQIIMNLCTNAAQAMEENGGLLQIGLATVEIDSSEAAEHLDLEPGNYQKLTISDTGLGMDEKTLRRAFEPFYTTKDIGQGTGMGLSVVHGIVKSHDGVVTASSELGKGSVFTVYLPVYKGKDTTVDGPDDAQPLGGDERILLVDDEETLAATGKAKLQRLGYQVTAATSSVKALEYFKKHPDAFDLVITDYTMPGMTGTTLSQKILSVRPDLPIIIVTGFSQQLTPERAKSLGIKRMVMKPLTGERFARAVREVLDE